MIIICEGALYSFKSPKNKATKNKYNIANTNVGTITGQTIYIPPKK
jgi:hypothetical protein